MTLMDAGRWLGRGREGGAEGDVEGGKGGAAGDVGDREGGRMMIINECS